MSRQRTLPSLAIVILAAGKGTRMKSPLPKVMHKLAGKPMINWLIETAQTLSPERLIVVTGPDMPDLERACAPHTTITQHQQLGTGDALKAALPALEGFKGNVLTLLGDAPLISAQTLFNLLQVKESNHHVGLSVLGVQLQNPTGYGRLITNSRHEVIRIAEEKDASDKERDINIVNTGAFCIETARLTKWLDKLDSDNAQGEYYLTDLPQIAAQEGATTRYALAHNPTEVMGCNTRADLALLESEVQKMLRHEHMQNGVTMIAPDTVTLSFDTRIDANTVIEPNVFFGPGVSIGSGCLIRSFCYLEQASVGNDTNIGPFAHIRPGSDIGEQVRIGNFVEIKKSTIGARSKISHLSYVGDCEMGEDVNFSAGAITVNYDGFQKHKTTIGNGVMIGSNVNLVAPLSIDNGAFIAAGSTITENVPADSLSITRDANKIREGWASEYRKKKKQLLQKLKGE